MLSIVCGKRAPQYSSPYISDFFTFLWVTSPSYFLRMLIKSYLSPGSHEWTRLLEAGEMCPKPSVGLTNRKLGAVLDLIPALMYLPDFAAPWMKKIRQASPSLPCPLSPAH